MYYGVAITGTIIISAILYFLAKVNLFQSGHQISSSDQNIDSQRILNQSTDQFAKSPACMETAEFSLCR